MAAPTQVFPPWLTPVPITSQVNGAPVVETSISFIPLGYFGPSIPLGSDFTFGGSTFPPSIEVGPPTTTPSSTSPSSTSTSASITSSPTSTSSIPSTSASSTASTSLSPSQSSVAAAAHSRGVSKGTKIAIGLSIGVVVILLLILWLVVRRNRRRTTRELRDPVSSGWAFVPREATAISEEQTRPHPFIPPSSSPAQQYVYSVRARDRRDLEASEPLAGPAPRTSGGSSGPDAAAADGVNSTTSNRTHSTMAPSALFYNSPRSHDTPREMEETARQSSSLGAEISDGSGKYAALPPGASPPLLPTRSRAGPLSFFSDEDAYIPGAIASTSRHKARQHSTESLPYPESPPSEVDESATLLTAQRVDAGRQVPVSTLSQQRHSPDNTREASTFGASLMGLTQLTGLHRLSWLRRSSNQAPTAYRYSSPPLSPTEEMQRTSSFNRLSFHPASRPHSAILYPGQESRPPSDFNYFNLADNELGLRPPTALFSTGHSSGSRSGGSGNGSGSARSGPTVYHSATSRSHSLNPSALDLPQRTGGLVDLGDTDNTAQPPEENTIRTVDVLDIPVPEPILPFHHHQAPSSPVNLLSRTPSPHFPPGLVAVPRWDAPASPSPELADILDSAPPRSPAEWSSMKGRRSSPDSNSPVQRAVDTEHTVEVASASLGPMSEEAIIEPFFLGSPVTAGFSLTPRVSLYASSEHVSHNTGSHSSRPSEHTSFSHETQGSQNDPHSDDDYHPPPVQRASLSAIGGHRLRHRPSAVAERVLPAPEERVSEEERSRAGSRPGSIVSGQTASETVVSRSTSNPAVPQVVGSFDSVGKSSGQEAASIVDVLQSHLREH